LPTIFDIEKQMRQKIDAKDAQTLEAVARAYGEVYRNVQAEIEALLYKLETGNYTKSTVTKLAQYNRLIGEIEKELTKYGGYLETTIRGASREMIGWGLEDSARKVEMILAEHGIKLDTDFRTMNPDSIEKLITWLDKESPLFKRIQTMPKFTAQGVADQIIAGVAKGDNPRTIAKDIENALGGGLTDALRMTRTVQLWSYREATRANYMANSDVVTGWIWWAELGDACPACTMQHGTPHGLDETLDDHYNGHCTMLPMVLGFNPVQDQQTGEQWFKEQPENVQREMLGAGKYDAWQNGNFELSKLVQHNKDEVYGEMVGVASLKDLSGGK
jgi:hypothetical protein